MVSMLTEITLTCPLHAARIIQEKGVQLLRHPVGNKRLGVRVGMNAVILHHCGFRYTSSIKTVTEEYRTLWRA